MPINQPTFNQYYPGGAFKQMADWVAGLGANDAVSTAISTVGAGVLSAAGIVGGVIVRSGSTGAFSDATDTAVNILAALPQATVTAPGIGGATTTAPSAPVGTAWTAFINNTTAFAQTVTAGVGVTLSGLAGPIPANSTAQYLVTYVSATAVTMQLVSVVYNAAGGADPATVTTFFGGGTGSFTEEGNISLQVPNGASGISPGAIGVDSVLAVFSIPASSFNLAGKGVNISAQGKFGATANNKDVKIIFNPSTAVVGSTVGTGGTTVADTGVVATNGAGWAIGANIFKFGAAGSNTQVALHQQAQVGAAVSALVVPTFPTAVESGAILVAVTGNAATATSDIVLNFLQVSAFN